MRLSCIPSSPPENICHFSGVFATLLENCGEVCGLVTVECKSVMSLFHLSPKLGIGYKMYMVLDVKKKILKIRLGSFVWILQLPTLIIQLIQKFVNSCSRDPVTENL